MFCNNNCDHCIRLNSYNPEQYVVNNTTGVRIYYDVDKKFIDHICEVMLRSRKWNADNINEDICLYYIKFYNIFLTTNFFMYHSSIHINIHGISAFFRCTLLKNDLFNDILKKYKIDINHWILRIRSNFQIECLLCTDARCTVKEYHLNGKVKTEIKYIKSGKKSGVFREWYDNGVLKTDGSYKCDKKEGVWTIRYENGNIMETGLYSNNLKRNEWKYYYETGALKECGCYKIGKRNGFWKEYSEEGNETIKEYEKNKVVITTIETIKRKTDTECLIYKEVPPTGNTYIRCKHDHIMDYEFMVQFKKTKQLKNIKCVYCSNSIINKIYEQI